MAASQTSGQATVGWIQGGFTFFAVGSSLLVIGTALPRGLVVTGAVVAAHLMWLAIDWADLRERRVPNRLVGLLSVTMLIVVAGVAWAGVVWVGDASAGDTGLRAFLGVLMLAVGVVVAAFLLHVVDGAGLGMGDVKLLFPTALALGLFGGKWILFGVAIAVVLACVALVPNVARRRPLPSLPFAPFLHCGVVVAVAVGLG